MPAKKLKEFLDSQNIKYLTVTHSRACTAQEIAESAHIPGKEVVKTVIAKKDGKMIIVALPATSKVDFNLLRKGIGANKVELANEQEFKGLFPECELGAMPPFGNLFNMEVYVAESLSKDDQIAFNAGTHTELIKLAYKDFERLVKPKVIKL